MLDRLAALAAAMPTGAVVRATVSAPSPTARRTGEKTSEERMELRDPILGDVDNDLLVLIGCGAWI
jgi:hypothetical protein